MWKNPFWAQWDFLLQYLKWPLERKLPRRHIASPGSNFYSTSMNSPSQVYLMETWEKSKEFRKPHIYCTAARTGLECVASFAPPCVQVVWRCAVGDRHAGGAALPGSVQRAGAALRHGRRPAGEAAELPRHAVSHPAHTNVHTHTLLFVEVPSCFSPSRHHGGGSVAVAMRVAALHWPKHSVCVFWGKFLPRHFCTHHRRWDACAWWLGCSAHCWRVAVAAYLFDKNFLKLFQNFRFSNFQAGFGMREMV